MRWLFVGLLVSGALGVACGSRGPLDITGVDYSDKDASVSDAAPADASADAAPEDSGVDAGRDAGLLVNCAQCVAQKCGQQLFQCFQSTTCRSTLQCAVQNCLSGMGGFDTGCLLSKCGQNLQGFAQLLGVVTCVASNCGKDCLTVLGGM